MKSIRKRLSHIVAVSALASAMAFVGCKSKAPALDDATVSAALQSRLQSDTGLAGEAVQATVQNGVATLAGTVSSEAARSLAANDAAEVTGIRTVENDLAVRQTAVGASGRQSTSPPLRKGEPKDEHRFEANNQPNSAPIERLDPNQRAPDQTFPQSRPTPPSPPPAPTFRNVTVPVGTGISVRITETLDSATTQSGSTFSGVLASDVIVDGLVAFPSGTRVTGHVDDAKDAGHFSGNSLLALSLTGISRRGENVTISTDTFSKEGKGRGKNTAEKIGGGAAVGAILGGIFGGGKGAAIGAGAGGGLGAGANGVTRGEQVQIPSETLIRFRLSSPVTVKASNQSDDNGGDLRRHDQ